MPNPKGHEGSIKDSRFKAAWQSGLTRTIRVPIALADATLEYARQLDRGIEPRDTTKMFDCGTEAVIFEPRDTLAKPDSSTYKKVDAIVAEPHDTTKMQAELESIRANYDVLLNQSSTSTRILLLPFKLMNRRNELKIWNNANMNP